MLPAGSIWAAGARYTDSGVFDTDFFDPQITGNAADNDTNNFDRSGDAIAYFTGHGVCNPISGATNTSCTHNSQCNSPPAGASLPGNCKSAPGFPGAPAKGLCHYKADRHLYTCGAVDQHNHDVDYSSGSVKWGEGAQGGGWAGAGTNGGVNLVVLDISCAVLPWFEYYQLGPTFAGVHLITTLMPVNGDLANVSNRGAAFAARWAANSNGNVADAWMETMNSLPQNEGSACGAVGGGRGINGCGLYFAMTMDGSDSVAQWKINTESWLGLQFDSNDGTGNSYYYTKAYCNYDCVTFPILLP
jgi:hypothetical protein